MALTRITKGVIKPNENYDTHDINSTGIITATGANITGNMTVGGVLTYEDVTSIDSVGLVTARDGIFIPDNKKLELGNAAGSGDLQLYHDTSNSYIVDNGPGQLYIRGSAAIHLENSSGSEKYFRGVANGAAELYYNGNKKLETSNTGVTVTGGISVSGSVSSGGLGISAVAPTIYLYDTDADSDFSIQVNSGLFKIMDSTNSYATRLSINSSGNVSIAKDLDVDGHTNLDNVSVAGVTTFTGTVSTTGNFGTSGQIQSTYNHASQPRLYLSGISGSSGYNYLLRGDNDGGSRAVHFVNGSARSADNGANTYTIRNDNGKLHLGRSNQLAVLQGSTTYLQHGTSTKLQTSSTGVTVTGTVAATSFTGDGSNLTGISGVTINNNADNRIITGSGTAATLNGESNLTFDGSDLTLNGRLIANEGSPPATGPNHFISDDGSTTTLGTAATLRVANDGGNAAYSVFEAESGSGSIRLANDGQFYVTGSAKFSTRVRVDKSSTVDGFMGEAYTGYFGLKHTDQTLNSEYMILSQDTHTFISASSGSSVYIRGGGNSSTNEMVVSTSGTTIGGNLVLTTANEGSGNGLDADTVDGIQGSSFVRSDATDTLSGELTLYNNLLKFSGTSNDRTLIHFIKSNEIKWRLLQNSSGESLNFHRMNGNGEFRVQGYRVLTTIDEGSGNGLDADTLDGVQGSSFLRSDANDTSSGTVAFGVGALDPDSFASFSGGFGGIADGSGWGARGVFVHGGGTGDAAAMAHNGSKLYFGIQNGSGANSMETWLDVTPGTRVINFQTDNDATNVQIGSNKIFHAGNDGSGSGLDADLLDGAQGSSYLRSDADDVATKRIVFQNNNTDNEDTIATTTSYQGGIEIYNSGQGNDAFMAFHAGSDYAFYFGLDADTNKLAVGGWSMGAAKYAIYHEGNKPTSSDLNLLSSNSDDTATGRIVFENNATDNEDTIATTTSYQGGIEIKNSGAGNDAFMAFHAGSDYALYFGLDADVNRLAVGGWSMGAVKHSILTERYATIRGSSAGDNYGITISMDGTLAPASVGHTANSLEGIFWHSAASYSIARTAGSWGGPNYQQLRLDWPTGIIIDGGQDYGLSGCRFECHALPKNNNSYDLGSSSLRWRNVYTNDLNLSNEGGKNDVDGTWGNYTIQEGESDLFLINKRNGKKYKFNLTEIS